MTTEPVVGFYEENKINYDTIQFNGLDEMEEAEAIRNAIYFPYFAFLTKSY